MLKERIENNEKIIITNEKNYLDQETKYDEKGIEIIELSREDEIGLEESERQIERGEVYNVDEVFEELLEDLRRYYGIQDNNN